MHSRLALFLFAFSRKVSPLLSLGTIFFAICISSGAAADHRLRVVADAKYLIGLVATPVPDYPEEAIRHSWTGHGVFELHFQPDGRVKEVLVILTTGHAILDETARETLLRWRCQPGAILRARMMMSFTSGTGLVKVTPGSQPARANLVSATRPQYPEEARRQRWSGSGVFVIRFGLAGNATDVVLLKSTGHARLDSEAITTFRTWRCRPGVYKMVIVPIAFRIDQERFLGPHSQ
ncbi:MAG: energy transducer TonB [Chthoniobacterales bacterium]